MIGVDLRYEQFWGLALLLTRIGKWVWNVRGVVLTWQELIYYMSSFEDFPFYWWELTSGVWNVRGVVLTWQVWRLVTPCRGETSEVYTRLGVLKIFIIRGVVLNLTMIAFMDLPLYRRELVGDFWWKNKINCQRWNINMTIINFLGTWEVHR